MQPELIAGRYQVLRAIGRGGMGTVWLCRDNVLGRHVAVKQIGALPGDSAPETKRAMREARSAAALNHPNAVAVYDVVDHEGRPWLVMEYVEGQTLADEIAHEGQLSPQRVADIGSQLAGALARAHERRIVHRDIKPGNVLIDKSGHPKISDFGIARGHGDEQLTQIGFITGTPGYLSPELARGGDPGWASDVWALGATLYEAVEGRPPYESRSNPIALLRAIATERPRAMTQAGVLGPAIEAMMHEDPASRWDMATCARRLGGIARITGLMPRLDPAETAVMQTPPINQTQRLSADQPLAEDPVAGVSMTKPPTAAAQPHPAASPPAASPAALPPAASPPAAPPPAAPLAAAAVVGKSSADESIAKESTPSAPKAENPMAEPPESRSGRQIPGSGPPGTGRPPGAGSPEPSVDRRSQRRWLSVIFVAVVAIAFGVAFLLSQVNDKAGTAASPATSTPTAISPTTPTPTTPTPTTTTPTTPRATVAPTTPDPPVTTSPPATVAAPPADRAQRIKNLITSYYSQVTNDPNSTWDSLSPRMKEAAGGRNGYFGFWGTISKVSVHRVRVSADNTAVVNLTYTRNDGTRSTENKQLTFVPQGDGFLIDSERPAG
ncbi:MAG: eukaryotic-like serine/threonine-protein kinase [Actinomycetota bacterium]|nr:eukaryotic-like serine/threonine-protein kinase [Actinomycetota bacterium]